MSTNSNMASAVLACLVLFGLTDFCESEVTITTQPNDVTVLSGGTAVFTCVVDLGNGNANTDDVKWNNMGNAITRASTDPYMVNNDFETFGQDTQLNSTLTIKNVNTHHAGLYQFVLCLNDGDVMSRAASLNLLTARIATQPSDVTVCIGESIAVAMLTCAVDRNGVNITSDDVKWQQKRVGGGISTLSTSLRGVPFNITTTISGDILISTLTITGVTASNILGTSLYRCVVNDMMSRDASLHISTGLPMNIKVSKITSMSFIVHWDEVDGAERYFLTLRNDGDGVNEVTTQTTSRVIMGLTPNTTYHVTISAMNLCGQVSGNFLVTTNATEPSLSTSLVMTTTSTVLTSTVHMTMPTPLSVMTSSSTMRMASSSTISSIVNGTATPAATSNSSSDSADSGSDGGSGGAGGIIGGVAGGIIAVIVVIIIIVMLYWLCVYKKKGGTDLEKETYAALQSPTGSLAKGTFPESQYNAVDKPGTRVVPHQSSAGGVEYAVSTKTASMASLNESPPEYAYVAVDKKKHIVGIITHQSSATGVQYAVSTKAAEAKDPHRYDEIRDEPGDVPHLTSTSGAEYAVSTKATTYQFDDVKDKSPAPQRINYAEIQHEPTPGVRVVLDNDPVVHYTQVS